MPNRNIKESILTSDTLDQLTANEERLFYRLIVICDDYGRTESKSQIIKSRCFPLKDDLSVNEVEQWLQGLAKTGAIIIYQVGNKRYLEMTGWNKYQRVRATASKYPPSSEADYICGHSLSTADNCCQPHALTDTVTDTVTDTDTDTDTDNGAVPVKPKPKRKIYGEHKNVLLSDEEHRKLVEKFGTNEANRWIEELSRGIALKGYKYKSHYLAVLKWYENEKNKSEARNNGTRRQSARELPTTYTRPEEL